MITSLFRQESIEANASHWIGTVRIAKKPIFSVIALISIFLIAALITYSMFGEISRKTRIQGVLTPVLGSVQLSANTAGVLLEHLVEEGSAVIQGQSLFILSTDRYTLEGSTVASMSAHLKQRLTALQIERAARVQQAHQREEALQDRIKSLLREITQAKQESMLVYRRVDLAQKTLERYQQMVQEGYISFIQAQSKQEELIDLQTRSENVQRSAVTLHRELESTEAELIANKLQLNTELAQLNRTQASIEQEYAENESKKTIVINAPQSGTVATIYAAAGSSILAGQSIAALIPKNNSTAHSISELQANLYAPSKTIGFVKPGQNVWIRYSAYPYQKFGLAHGIIKNVSPTPIAAQDLPTGTGVAMVMAAQTQEPLYRIQVKLNKQTIGVYGENKNLISGMTLEADILQEKRKIWEWFLEPILAILAKNSSNYL